MDRDAEFLYVPAAEVLEVAVREGAIPYDVAGVELGHVDGRCSFESIILKYDLQDPALETPLFDALYAWCQHEAGKVTPRG
ncbi:MAG: chromate resistance protein ChrB domain-containing protein [Candidatus Dormibacteraceae bacterium]